MISIVSPVYKAEKILPTLVEEIRNSMQELGLEYEVILVDDRSPDNSWQIMISLSKQYEEVKSFRLSKNFGQHPTIMAGLSKASGDWIVVLDCDLQDRPKEISKLYMKALEGYDIVMAKRINRKDNILKRVFSKAFSTIFNYLSDVKMNHEIANFGIYKRKVITEVLNLGDYIKSFPHFVYFVGFKRIAIEIEHDERFHGKSNYTFKKLVSLAINTTIAYSNKPLKIFLKIGLIISTVSFVIGIYYLMKYFKGEIVVLGFTSLIVSMFFLSGMLISIVGLVGVYLGKNFEQSKNRPGYIFDEN
jgi:glycosyltransferase involved in cell wall biosynthesis